MNILTREKRVVQTIGLVLIGLSLADHITARLLLRDSVLVVWLPCGLLGCCLVVLASPGYRSLAITGSLLASLGGFAPLLYARFWFVDNGKSLRLIMEMFYLWDLGLLVVAAAVIQSLGLKTGVTQ